MNKISNEEFDEFEYADLQNDVKNLEFPTMEDIVGCSRWELGEI